MIYSIAAVLAMILDQAVKYFTIKHIPLNAVGDQCIPLIPGVLHMTNVRNTGAAFSIFPNARLVLIGISAAFIIAIVLLINSEIIHTRFGRWTASLVAAGALANCIDRVLFGYVVDMFEFELFSFAVFNVADIFITVCGLLFCVHVIIYRDPLDLPKKEERQPKKKEKRPARVSELEEEDDYEEREVREEPPRTSSRRNKKSAPPKEDPYANIPHRGQHRSLEEDLRLDPSDPFAEWSSPQPSPHPAASAAPETPNVLGTPDAPETPDVPKAERREPATQRRASRSALLDDLPDFDVDLPDLSRVKPAEEKPARQTEPDRNPPAPAEPAADIGFEEYSLEDILSEFRDQ